MAEDDGAGGAGDLGQVARPAVPRLVGQDGEGHGFFGLAGIAGLVVVADGGGCVAESAGHVLADHPRQRGVVRAAAAQEYLVGWGGEPAAIGVGDGGGGEGGHGSGQVGGGQAAGLGLVPQVGGEGSAKGLPPGGLGRRLAQVGMVEQAGQQPFVYLSLGGQLAVPVAAPGPAGSAGCDVVYQGVAGAGIEGHHALRPATGRQVGDVGDAADVLQHPRVGSVVPHQPVGIGDERCSLPAGRQVGRAKVGHGGDTRACDDDGRVADLHREGRPAL